MERFLLSTSAPLPPFRISSVKLSGRFDARFRATEEIVPLSSSSFATPQSLPAVQGGKLLPNAQRRKLDPNWRSGGFSLGVDLGDSRTGLALGKGYSPRPLSVLDLRGRKLELRLIDIAVQEEVDEFVIGLPKSHDGKETSQSNKVRSIAGRIAVLAAERGLRVFLLDEYGTSMDALDYMIDNGLKKSDRRGKIDAYSAMMVLQRYFAVSGQGTELVLPKQLDLQEKLRKGPDWDMDF